MEGPMMLGAHTRCRGRQYLAELILTEQNDRGTPEGARGLSPLHAGDSGASWFSHTEICDTRREYAQRTVARTYRCWVSARLHRSGKPGRRGCTQAAARVPSPLARAQRGPLDPLGSPWRPATHD